MAVSKIVKWKDGTYALRFYCSGCKHLDEIPFERGENYQGPIWQFTGTEARPTISPSVRNFFPAHDEIPEQTTCHYHLKNGVQEFCGDCKHELNGKIIPLQDYHELPQYDGYDERN